jgi:hypothetical protein
MALLSNNTSSSDDRLTIVCLYCDKPQEISRRARSVTCKFCCKPLKLEDITIKAYEARRVIETVGIVTVEKKGWVFSDRINCGGLVVRGKVKGHVTSRGPVLVGPDAEIKGDVEAPTLAVGAGAVLEGHYRIGRIIELPPEMAAEQMPSTPVDAVRVS